MKLLVLLCLYLLSSCSAHEQEKHDLATAGSACIYEPEKFGSLYYLKAEKYVDESADKDNPKYWVEFMIELDPYPPKNWSQLMTAACADEFKSKNISRASITKIRWGGCAPMKLIAFDLENGCATQFIGN